MAVDAVVDRYGSQLDDPASIHSFVETRMQSNANAEPLTASEVARSHRPRPRDWTSSVPVCVPRFISATVAAVACWPGEALVKSAASR